MGKYTKIESKQLLAFLLSLSLLISTGVPTFAKEDNANSATNSYIQEIDGGYLFSQTTDDKSIAILTNSEKHLINVGIVYSSQPNSVYQWLIYDYPISTLAFIAGEESFWQNVVNYAEFHKDLAFIAEVETAMYETPEIMPFAGSNAAIRELKSQMIELVGNEYEGMLRYTKNYAGQQIRIYGSMYYNIYKSGTKTWKNALTVAGAIATIGGICSSGALAFWCGVFGLVTIAADIFLPDWGSVDLYTCRAQIARSATINGSTYVYNICYKFITYDGYDVTDGSVSADSTKVIADTREISFPDGEDYWDDYEQQAMDAYLQFTKIGQKS